MPFTRPTLTQIIDRAKTDLQDKLTSGSAVLRRAVIAVLARVIAGASHVLHGHVSWAILQLFPTLADEEYLLRWGSIWQVTRKPATFTQRDVLFTGVIGSVIAADAVMQRSDGVLYSVVDGGTFTDPTLTLGVIAQVAGADGNVDPGVKLSFIEPVTGVQNEAVVQGTNSVDGADLEDLELYRERLLFRIANTPQGGTEADYIRWALEVAGVTRAFVLAGDDYLGPNTVGVSFVRDGDLSIIPDAGEVAEVQAYLDARRPITTEVFAYAPTTLAVPFNIDLLADDTADIRAAVTAELKDLFTREGKPGGTILLSHIQEAISLAAGETDHVLNTPTANVVPPGGELPIVGTITWS